MEDPSSQARNRELYLTGGESYLASTVASAGAEGLWLGFPFSGPRLFRPPPDQRGPLCPAGTRRCKSKGLDRRCCDVSRLVGLVRLNSEFASSGEMLDPTCPLCTRTARSHHDESGCHD